MVERPAMSSVSGAARPVSMAGIMTTTITVVEGAETMAVTSLMSLKSASVAHLKLLALLFVVVNRNCPALLLLDTIFFAADGEACSLVFIDRL